MVGNNFSSKLLRIASECNKCNVLFYMPKRLAKLHEMGDLYYHDLDSYNLTTNCLHNPLGKLLENGFNTGYGDINRPKRIETAGHLSCIVLQSNQNDQYGGQSFANFSNDLAPYVECTRKEVTEEINEVFNFTGTTNENDVSDLVEKRVIKKIHQAMQGVCYNLNTMHSRAGSQVPFSSINIGLPESKDAYEIEKAFLEEFDKGMGKGTPLIFPNVIFRVKDGVNKKPGDPYYDLFQLACKVASRRMNPTFMNIDADFNLEYYEKGYIPATMG